MLKIYKIILINLIFLPFITFAGSYCDFDYTENLKKFTYFRAVELKHKVISESKIEVEIPRQILSNRSFVPFLVKYESNSNYDKPLNINMFPKMSGLLNNIVSYNLPQKIIQNTNKAFYYLSKIGVHIDINMWEKKTLNNLEVFYLNSNIDMELSNTLLFKSKKIIRNINLVLNNEEKDIYVYDSGEHNKRNYIDGIYEYYINLSEYVYNLEEIKQYKIKNIIVFYENKNPSEKIVPDITLNFIPQGYYYYSSDIRISDLRFKEENDTYCKNFKIKSNGDRLEMYAINYPPQGEVNLEYNIEDNEYYKIKNFSIYSLVGLEELYKVEYPKFINNEKNQSLCETLGSIINYKTGESQDICLNFGNESNK